MASPDGTQVPPATQIVSTAGNVYTFDGASTVFPAPAKNLEKNGQLFADGSTAGQMIACGGFMYAQNTVDGNWYKYDDSGVTDQWILIGLNVPCGPAPAPAPQPTGAAHIVIASAAGAKLDSDILAGSGTDDTAVLQSQLDLAMTGPLVLVIDGVALVSGLTIHRNTHLAFLPGCGLYLKDNSNRAAIRNANLSLSGMIDSDIAIVGGVINGNRAHQAQRDAAGYLNTGLQLFGINNLRLRNVTVRNARNFATHIANVTRLAINNYTSILGGPSTPYDMTDGLHLNGPLSLATINGLTLEANDDCLALNANDGPNFHGSITDVSISNVTVSGVSGIRLLSITDLVDRIAISNVTGSLADRAIYITKNDGVQSGSGNFGKIAMNNLNLDMTASTGATAAVVILDGNANIIAIDDVSVKSVDSRPLLLNQSGVIQQKRIVINGVVQP